jgi:hypothetical protein
MNSDFARRIDDIDMYFKHLREKVAATDPELDDPIPHLISIELAAANVECAVKLLKKHCDRAIKKANKEYRKRMAA